MSINFELRHDLYLKELSHARRREIERKQHLTFFYVQRPMEVQLEEELEHAVRYHQWRIK